MSSTRAELERAYRLIKEDQIREAEEIIRPVLADDPENVHAWWLLAYAVTDPAEIREALTNVLMLDPSYSNAPKAREMLERLDEQYPEEEVDVFALAVGDTLDDADPFADDPFADVFSQPDELIVDEEPFADFEDLKEADDLFEFAPEDEVSARDAQQELEALFDDQQEYSIDDVTQAEREERAARPRRGRRLLAFVLFTALVAVIAVVVMLALISGDDSAEEDPGPLQIVEPQPDAVQAAKTAAESELAAANVGSEGRVVVAESNLGDTLFVEFCGQPDPSLSQKIMDGMQIAVRQAPAVANDLAAVGVSINLCEGGTRDTLYRAFVSVATARQYAEGGFGSGDSGLAGFQAVWQMP